MAAEFCRPRKTTDASIQLSIFLRLRAETAHCHARGESTFGTKLAHAPHLNDLTVLPKDAFSEQHC